MTPTEKDKKDKLAAAVYLVTDFLSDREPIKWKMRKLAISEAYAAETVNQLLSLIEIILMSRQGSVMNFSLLRDGYLSLRNSLAEKQEIKPLFDSLPAGRPMTPPAGVAARISSAASVRRDEPRRRESQNNGLNERQNQILRFLKLNNGASIKEISQAVPNFSGKTVQRELAALIKSGLLRREGDRRWSRYRI